MSRRARRWQSIHANQLVVGVDVAKRKHTAVGASVESWSKPRSFGSDLAGFEGLKRFAEQEVRRTGSDGFVVAMEPTGHYGLTLATWLVDRGIEVYSVQPLHTSRAKELYDNTWRKTDKKDSGVIASLARQGLCRPWRVPRGVFAELRVLSRQRQQTVVRRGQITNRLNRHVDVVFPEVRRLFSKITSKSFRWFLRHAPAPADVLALGKKELGAALRRESRGRLGAERAAAMVAAAQRSVGIRDGLAAHRLAIRQLLEELELLLPQLSELEKEMARLLSQVPYARHLLSIPKLGVVTTATLLGELGDLRSYRVANQLIKMAGLDLVENSSGEREGRRRISRRGRSYARQMLYLAAIRLGRGVLREQRRRMVEDNKVKPTKAAVANMSRILRIMHALARDTVDFEPDRYLALSEEREAA